jgi:hypothetical protein
VLPEQVLDGLTFKDIIRFRNTGVKLGYFDAIGDVQTSFGSASFDNAFLLYLKVLEQYLVAIGVEVRIELVDWQEQLARSYTDKREYEAMSLVSFGIPVILGATYSLVTQTPFPVSEVLGIGTGVEFLRRIRNASKPPALRRLLSGTTVTPPAARND